jgi:hypothetical protein
MEHVVRVTDAVKNFRVLTRPTHAPLVRKR